MNKTIQHTGIIERIEQPFVFVRIEQSSACSGCHAQAACHSSMDSQSRTVAVEDTSGNFTLRDEVLLIGRYDRGMQAVLLACVCPMLLVVAALIAGIRLTGSEVAGGGISLLVLLPYGSLIYLMRDRLKRKFAFTLSKIPVTL
jgi:sigma-E factor negative regulatory protein RseC